MSGIAPRRTGVVVFGAWIVSIFTGLLFLSMVTHRLTTSQFGLLEIITDIVAFSSYPVRIISFWAGRDTGRGAHFGRTAFLANLALSLGGCAVFTLFALAGDGTLASSAVLFVTALTLVPVAYWYRTANLVLAVHRPQATAYTLLATEASKLAIGFVVIFLLRWGLVGVLLSLAASNAVQGAMGTYYLRGIFAAPFSLEKLKGWMRHAWIPLLDSIPAVITTADTYVVFLVSGAYTLTGYYQAAFAIAAMVTYSRYLSSALYPLLLRGSVEKVIAVLFDLSMMVGIPMAVGLTALAPQFLYLLSRRYLISSIPLAILSFSALANATDTLLDNSLMGKDTSDLAQQNKLRSLLKGNLFFVPVVNLAYGLSYITSLAIITFSGLAYGLPNSEIITLWAVDQLLCIVIFAAPKVRRLGLGAFAGTGRPIIYYSASALVMAAVVYLAAPLFVNFQIPTVEFGLRFLLLIVLGGGVYFGLLASIDKKSRERIARLPKIFQP